MTELEFKYRLASVLEYLIEYGEDCDLPNQDGGGELIFQYAKELASSSSYHNLEKLYEL